MNDALAIVEREMTMTPAGLFRDAEPSGIVRQATAIANELKKVIEERELFTKISNRRHVRVEGWCLLGTMLGVFPVPVKVEALADGRGYLAQVEARTMSGAVVGSAFAICTREERNWADRDEFALLSMAQTRATGKAMRLPVGFVVTLAGYDATPAEEMEIAQPVMPAPVTRRERAAQLAQAQAPPEPPHPDAQDTGDRYHGEVIWRVGGVACMERTMLNGSRYLQSLDTCDTHNAPCFLSPDGAPDQWAHGKGAEKCWLVPVAAREAAAREGQ